MKFKHKCTMILIAVYVSIVITPCMDVFAAEKPAEKAQKKNQKSGTQKPAAPNPGGTTTKVDATGAEDTYIGTSSTHIDFSETSIDGKMKAPDGFMLQGHQSSSLSQMVKLRNNFRNELNNSRTATKALVK